MINRAFSILGISLLVLSCNFTGSNSDEEQTLIPTDAASIEYEDVAIGTETISQSTSGSYAFEEKAELVVDNQSDFKQFWDQLHESVSPKPELPSVDFNEWIVLAAMMGIQSSGGYATEIQRVATDDNSVWVEIRESEPGTGCAATAVLTSPYHAVKIPGSIANGKEIRFVTDRVIIDC